MMRIASFGLVGFALAAMAGCSTAPETSSGPAVAKPSALAKVTASARTRKLSGLPTWQVYNGYGHVAALGFDKKGRPVDGLRIVYADASGPVHGIRFETVRHRGVLAFDAEGNVVTNTLSYADLRTVYGGYRAVHAVAKSGANAGSTAARAFRAFADDCDAGDYLGAAGNCWKHGGCIASGIAAGVATGGAAGLATAGGCLRAIDPASHLACGSSAYKVGKCLYEKVKGAVSNESKAKDRADQKAAKEAALDKAGEPKAPEAKQPDGTKDPSCTDGSDPSCGTTDPTSQDPSAGDPSCTDESDPSCSAGPESPETSCGPDDPDCSANVPEEQEETASEPTEEPEPDTELDPNPADPDETASSEEEAPPADEPAAETPPAPEQNDAVSASLRGGLRVAAFTPSTSKAVAKRIGGACRASHVLQCGTRKSGAFCRCVKL